MKKNMIYNRIFFAAALLGTALLASCVGDLDVTPIDPKIKTSPGVYDDPDAYRQVIAKCYAGLAVSGQQGPAGQGDISGLDEGFGQYLRGFWYVSELTTDEAVVGWNDNTIYDFHNQSWGAMDGFIGAFYSRVFYQISLCNEFIRESKDDVLAARGISGSVLKEIQAYHAEARFLRALSYWHGIDCFGNVPFVTEDNKVGGSAPDQKSRADVFAYIESELKEIENQMIAARSNEYGRADQAAVWMLLAKLYLNAKVYTGTERWSDCIAYCNKILAAGYTLEPKYKNLFLADNDLCAQTEVIFAVRFDGLRTQTYGGTNFIVFAQVGGNMSAAEFGISSGWGGYRTTKQMVQKFADPSGNTDTRALFHTSGQSLEINAIGEFTDGYAFKKWRNVTRDGAPASSNAYVDTDFPMFRLADVYLMYAEAVLRGGQGGSSAQALTYVNQLRERAYGSSEGNIAAAGLTLEFILNERARELYTECHRRTDLIRFDQFSNGTYVWAWKGGVAEGRSVDAYRNLFPIPASDLNANPKLKQNPGY